MSNRTRIVAPEDFAIVTDGDDGSRFLGHPACSAAICDVEPEFNQADLNAFAANHECQEA